VELGTGAVENVVTPDFWGGKRVLVTGHTGFKGGWLSLWLQSLGAKVTGYALAPYTTPNLFEAADVGDGMISVIADVKDFAALKSVMLEHRPEVVFHLAAQPLVRLSYDEPVRTYSTNVIGTVHVLEAARAARGLKGLICVTSDKCYENREWAWGYRENDTLGGHDPYSSSKACAELVTTAYQRSYFPAEEHGRHGVAVASVRAGNVIGGGDWAADRLVPDFMRAAASGEALVVRNPRAMRPWQHVLEPLHGYLMLAERLWNVGPEYGGAWNFGPDDDGAKTVEQLVETLRKAWGDGVQVRTGNGLREPHEAAYLKLDCSKAKSRLGWRPRWSLDQALEATAQWYSAHRAGRDMRRFSIEQMRGYAAQACA
jgi:CDP-glucose 4,6-dehydratase